MAAAKGRRAVDASWDWDSGHVRKFAEQLGAGDPPINSRKHERSGTAACREDDEYSADDHRETRMATKGHSPPGSRAGTVSRRRAGRLMMVELKLPKLPDRTPVKISITV